MPDDTEMSSTVSLVAAAEASRGRNSASRGDTLSSVPDAFYKSAQWTADGTTIITTSSDNQICSFVLPEALLEPRNEPLFLIPQNTLSLPETTHVVSPAPYFSLLHAQTQTLLVACRDHPVQIFPALPPCGSDASTPSPSPSSLRPLASYNLIKPQTEAYLCPTSLVWPYPGTHFTAGGTNILAQFDVTRTGEGPIRRVHTIPSTRHLSKGSGVGMRGTVSALSVQHPDDANGGGGLVAAATWTRWVGLYDFCRSGESVATWSVASAAASAAGSVPDAGANLDSASKPDHKPPKAGIGGQGIMQTFWSPCGRYLMINERQATGILVYDVRVTGQLLGFLAGRDALTHQRLSCDVFSSSSATSSGFEVWAGTQDGTVKVWDDVGTVGGCMKPSWGWHTQSTEGGGALGSVSMHPSGSVVATCSGSWIIPEDDESDSDESPGGGSLDGLQIKQRPARVTESSLKIWSIGTTGDGNLA